MEVFERSQIRLVGGRWSAGECPGSKPGRRRSQFREKGDGRLTVVVRRRRGVRRWGRTHRRRRREVVGGGGWVGEVQRTSGNLVGAVVRPEEDGRRPTAVRCSQRRRPVAQRLVEATLADGSP
jgi:hypothetical protein